MDTHRIAPATQNPVTAAATRYEVDAVRGIAELRVAAEVAGVTVCQVSSIVQRLAAGGGAGGVLGVVSSMLPSLYALGSSLAGIDWRELRSEARDLVLAEVDELLRAGISGAGCLPGPVSDLANATVDFVAGTIRIALARIADGRDFVAEWTAVVAATRDPQLDYAHVTGVVPRTLERHTSS